MSSFSPLLAKHLYLETTQNRPNAFVLKSSERKALKENQNTGFVDLSKSFGVYFLTYFGSMATIYWGNKALQYGLSVPIISNPRLIDMTDGMARIIALGTSFLSYKYFRNVRRNIDALLTINARPASLGKWEARILGLPPLHAPDMAKRQRQWLSFLIKNKDLSA